MLGLLLKSFFEIVVMFCWSWRRLLVVTHAGDGCVTFSGAVDGIAISEYTGALIRGVGLGGGIMLPAHTRSIGAEVRASCFWRVTGAGRRTGRAIAAGTDSRPVGHAQVAKKRSFLYFECVVVGK